MKRKIIVNDKEFTMPKMSIDTYTEYLELAEVIDAKQRYSKEMDVLEYHMRKYCDTDDIEATEFRKENAVDD